MKKHITILLLLVLTFSCADTKKNKLSDSNEIAQVKNDTYLSAKIDGETFYTDALTCLYFSDKNAFSISTIPDDNKESFLINVVYKDGPATYIFDKSKSKKDNMIYVNNLGPWLAQIIGDGTITLTEEGGYLMGQFSFTAENRENKNTKQITDGKFKVLIKKME